MTAIASVSMGSFGRPVLEDLQIQFGPVTVLGRFFLLADALLAKAGVTLYLVPLADAVATHASNVDSWHAFPPMLDTRLSNIDPATSYGLLGCNERGDIVCAQGGRVYDLGNQSFADVVADQSFFYGAQIPPAAGQPVAEISAPSASLITGRFVYSGGLWVHPDYRGRHLTTVLPRFSRCYALAKWDTQFTVGMANERNFSERLVAAYGYEKVERRFTIHNMGPDPMTLAVLWMNRDDLIGDLTGFVDAQISQIYSAVGDSGVQQQPRLLANRNR